jgi:UDP-MurNAc hydroxylase
MSLEIKFINHACFQIIKDDFSILVDPWFSGKVFNDSWKLLQDTNIDDVDLSNLKYIFISHEHPDHLNWPTLKKIREKCKQEITVVTRERDYPLLPKYLDKMGHKDSPLGKNPHDFLVKMGFNSLKVKSQEIYSRKEDGIQFCYIRANNDNAMIFNIEDKIIFNRNDSEHNSDTLLAIKEKFLKGKDIDILLNQFSLAGFYGNKEDTSAFYTARDKCVSDFLHVQEILNPKISVPFASFITFCRPKNEFLNNYIVSLEEVINDNKDKNIFVPYFLENIPFEMNKEKTEKNCQKWSTLFKKEIEKESEKVLSISEEKLKESFKSMIEQVAILKKDFGMHNDCPDDSFVVHVEDIDKYCEFSFFNDSIQFAHTDDLNYIPIATLQSYDLNGFFENPWGADTLNITSCFSVNNANKFKQMTVFRDLCYAR